MKMMRYKGPTIDLYALVLVEPHTDIRTIKGCYKIFASSFHPDKASDHFMVYSENIIVELNQVKEWIIDDPEKRAIYDAYHRRIKESGGRFKTSAMYEFRKMYPRSKYPNLKNTSKKSVEDSIADLVGEIPPMFSFTDTEETRTHQ